MGKTYILEEFGRNHYKNYIKVSLITHGFIPISAQVDDSNFKIYMSDVGLLNTKTQMPVQITLDLLLI